MLPSTKSNIQPDRFCPGTPLKFRTNSSGEELCNGAYTASTVCCAVVAHVTLDHVML